MKDAQKPDHVSLTTLVGRLGSVRRVMGGGPERVEDGSALDYCRGA